MDVVGRMMTEAEMTPIPEEMPQDELELEAFPEVEAPGPPVPDTPETPSLLAVDIGSVNTRSLLFDVVQGRYRFLASGTSPSTMNPPVSNAMEGVLMSLDGLDIITGRRMVSIDNRMIVPSDGDGFGADQLVVTTSSGAPLKIAVVGLQQNLSVNSALKLAYSTYAEVVAVLSLDSGDGLAKQLDKVVQARPDVVLIAGGSENGASQSVLKMVRTAAMAISLIPADHRPEVLYAGNQQLAEQVQQQLESITPLRVAPNLRPTAGRENIEPVQAYLNELNREIRAHQSLGVAELSSLARGNLIPTAQAMGRVVKFFSKMVPDPTNHGVLGVDVGATSTSVAAAFDGDLHLRAFSNLGVGRGLNGLLDKVKIEHIVNWLPYELPAGEIEDYIHNKIAHPHILPASMEDLAIEQALARQVMQMAIGAFEPHLPAGLLRPTAGLLPVFDPIVVSGSVVTNAPTSAQSLLMVLDALQPVGIHQVILDKNNLTAALGAAAPINPALVAQLLLDPISFLNLGFVVSPVGASKPGSAVLRLRIVYQDGDEEVFDIQQGSLKRIPLGQGQRATVYLDPLNKADLGWGPGKRVPPKRVAGGPFGLVVDARGRPLRLPENPHERRTLMQQWLSTLAG